MANTALSRTETALLTNKSGGSVAQYDVVVVDTTTASSFTTTTTLAYISGRIGVVLEPNGIANNASGLIAFTGWTPGSNLSGTGNIGDFVKTNNVAKQGIRHAAPQVSGDFAQVLGTSATAPLLLFGTVQLGGGTGANIISNSSISPTTTNVTAAVNTRYLADVSGLTASRNFVLPAGTSGDEIELNITTGDDTYALIIIGNTGITINGGSSATEWSRLFITGEDVRLIATSPTNWQVVHDGRKPCIGMMQLSGADTTNSAATDTTPTWDTKVVDRGEMCDTTNFRMNVRRAAYYRTSGSYIPNTAISDANYGWVKVFQNASVVNETLIYASGAQQLSLPLSPLTVLCAVGDTLTHKYNTQQSNRGILNDPRSFFQVEEVF